MWAEGLSKVASSREFLVGRCLSQSERQTYRSLSLKRQKEWLSGRIAAKDAARGLLWSQGSPPIFPLEINTIPIAEGGFKYDLSDLNQSNPPKYTQSLIGSLAHTQYGAIAIAFTESTSLNSYQVGIDCERIQQRDPVWTKTAFSHTDLKWVGMDPYKQTAGWSAKEALAKALGRGLGHPKKWEITQWTLSQDSQSPYDLIYINHNPVFVTIYKDHVIAWCIIELQV